MRGIACAHAPLVYVRCCLVVVAGSVLPAVPAVIGLGEVEGVEVAPDYLSKFEHKGERACYEPKRALNLPFHAQCVDVYINIYRNFVNIILPFFTHPLQ